ncbi:ABC transporter substrate-binding protein [Paenibacillus doosanensis]|uniref:Iron-uptake system-binding protein n=1 Tax=Paenibacillus konkukensis TaxID=2020716 RepID=A0ABY4RRV9_9BACL|nr:MULTISPECIES: ABC transporter substrate-binding protein [Paenibacillus]MCS7459165.1 ABC transporter substrate-binding protein [Paenibacillus doosanensis]UQZ84223.1 Iron-uptake system-binding protein precursor [Paenibacillus konkukensis]
MRKGLRTFCIAALVLALTACGKSPAPAAGDSGAGQQTQGSAAQEKTASPSKQSISYLGTSYTVNAPSGSIVITGALEAMEDALVLGVQPTGAITTGGKFPDMFKPITGSTQSIGEKMQPNMETILKLKPDVILSSTKFPADVGEKLSKIATTIPVSHIATNWEENLRLLGKLTGKEAKAEEVLKQYKEDVAAAKAKLGDKWKDKKVVTVRVRSNSLNIYPADVFFNPTLYSELGFAVPDEIKAAKAQQTISMEQFSAMNPDAIFVQFSEDENKDKPKVLEEIQNNPLWKSTNAAKNNKVFVNVVDPLAQGGASWSKFQFLKAAVDKLSN